MVDLGDIVMVFFFSLTIADLKAHKHRMSRLSVLLELSSTFSQVFICCYYMACFCCVFTVVLGTFWVNLLFYGR